MNKKKIAIIVAAVLVVGAIVLPKKDDSKKVDTTTATTTSEQKATETPKEESKDYKVGDTIETGDFRIKVNKVTKSKGDIIKPEKGNEFIKIDITLENTSSEQQNVSSLMMFKVIDNDGRNLKDTLTEDQNGQLDGSIPSKGKMSGEIYVEGKKGLKGLQLEFNPLTGSPVRIKLN